MTEEILIVGFKGLIRDGISYVFIETSDWEVIVNDGKSLILRGKAVTGKTDWAGRRVDVKL